MEKIKADSSWHTYKNRLHFTGGKTKNQKHIPWTRRWMFRVALIGNPGYQAVQDNTEPRSLYLTRDNINTLFTLPFLKTAAGGGEGITSPFRYHSMSAPGWPETRHVRLTELVRFSSTVSLGGSTTGTLPGWKKNVTSIRFIAQGVADGKRICNLN